MNTPAQLAKHTRDVFFGGNWTCVNMQQLLNDVNWQQAVTTTADLNSIAALVFHVGYYLKPITSVLRGGQLDASDKFSFDVPEISSEDQWQQLKERVFAEVRLIAEEIEKLPEDKLNTDFADAKYGSYYRNLLGLIEHTHYHLGQIALLKKLLKDNGTVPFS